MGSFSDSLIDFLCDLGPSHLRFDSIAVELSGKDLTGSKLRCSVFQHLSSVTGERSRGRLVSCICNIEMKAAT